MSNDKERYEVNGKLAITVTVHSKLIPRSAADNLACTVTVIRNRTHLLDWVS
jgi:hypothetical protein